MVNDQGDINDDYLNRIQKVVDDALDTGLYVEINIQSDGSQEVAGKWIDISLENGSTAFNNVVTKFSNMWKEIAVKFANYNEALIFEDMNEVMVGTAYTREDLTDDQFANAYANIVELNQAFVDAVRGTGNDANDDRVLVVPGYNTNIDMTLAGFDEGVFGMPDDTSTDRLSLSIHYYDPADFALGGDYGNTDTWDINGTYGIAYMESQLTKVSGYGVPVFVDEYSAYFKNNIPEVAEWVGALNAAAKAVQAETGTSFSTAYWDNGELNTTDGVGTGLINRIFNIVTPTGTTIINAIIPKTTPNP